MYGEGILVHLFKTLRLHACAPLTTIGYVDDVTIATRTPWDLERALFVVDQFSDDFHLDLSRTKTAVWGSDQSCVASIASNWGLSIASYVGALGVELAVGPSADMPRTREKKRIAKADDRLVRLSHLPAPIHIRAIAMVTGGLSLLAYAPCLHVSDIRGPRYKIKKAVGCPFGAPEIV